MSDETEFDPSRRLLCPDGSCTGVVGADGRCSECGRVGTVAGAGDAQAASSGEAVAPDESPDAEAAAVTAAEAELEDAEAGFDARRGLCPDGACVGVLDPDGRCPVCGQSSGAFSVGGPSQEESR